MDVQISAIRSMPPSAQVYEGIVPAATDEMEDNDFMNAADDDDDDYDSPLLGQFHTGKSSKVTNHETDEMELLATQRRLLYHKRQSRRMFSTNHVLPRKTRLLLWCLQTWSCVRVAWVATIVGCFLGLLLCSVGMVTFVQREWVHGLQPGWCHSVSCTSSAASPPSSGGTSPSCFCTMLYVASMHETHDMALEKRPIDSAAAGTNHTSPFTHNFNQTFQGFCPPPHDGIPMHGAPQFSFSCWINPAHQIWSRLPNLWILVLILTIASAMLASVGLCSVFATTQQANVLGNVNAKTRIAIQDEYLLQTAPVVDFEP